MEAQKTIRPKKPVQIAEAVQTLRLDQIKLEPDFQIRVSLNQETISEYIEDLNCGDVFPAIDVFHIDGEYLLVNGFHRVEAHRRAGLEKVNARIHAGGKRDALLFAIKADVNLGLRRTNADKRRAVETLLADEEWRGWSSGIIAQHAGVSDRFVDKLKLQSTPNGSRLDSVKYKRNGQDLEMKVPRTSKKESPKHIVDLDGSETVEPKSENQSPKPDGPAKVTFDDLNPARTSKSDSSFKKRADEFADFLGDALSGKMIPGEDEIAAIADVERAARTFLQKFSKMEA